MSTTTFRDVRSGVFELTTSGSSGPYQQPRYTPLHPGAHQNSPDLRPTWFSQVALDYASRSKASGILFQLEQGMVNRGANISWLSQYPHEREILFAPLSSLEARPPPYTRLCDTTCHKAYSTCLTACTL